METIQTDLICQLISAKPPKLATPKWKDAYRRLHKVSDMSTRYIQNCLAAFRRGQIPYYWHGGWPKWKEIFEEELARRQ